MGLGSRILGSPLFVNPKPYTLYHPAHLLESSWKALGGALGVLLSGALARLCVKSTSEFGVSVLGPRFGV